MWGLIFGVSNFGERVIATDGNGDCCAEAEPRGRLGIENLPQVFGFHKTVEPNGVEENRGTARMEWRAVPRCFCRRDSSKREEL